MTNNEDRKGDGGVCVQLRTYNPSTQIGESIISNVLGFKIFSKIFFSIRHFTQSIYFLFTIHSVLHSVVLKR